MFLDANVLFSAAIKPSSRIHALFELSEAGFCNLLTSTHAALEASRNIQVKFPMHLKSLEALLNEVTLVNEPDKALVTWAKQYLPDKDAPILAAALAGKADILVTGDNRHFGKMFNKKYKGVLVLTPAQALDYVLQV
jgi:uncharacterized protein